MAVSGGRSGSIDAQIRKFMTAENEAWDDLMRIIYSKMDELLNEMGQIWASPKAKLFFKNVYVPRVNGVIEKAYRNFSQVGDIVNQAGTDWARVNASSFAKAPFVGAKKLLDTSASVIKEEMSDGFKGIDKARATALVASLPSVKNEVSAAIAKVVQAAQNAGFESGNGALAQQMTSLKNSIEAVVEEVAREIKKGIDETVKEYGDQERSVTNIFEDGIGDFFSGIFN